MRLAVGLLPEHLQDALYEPIYPAEDEEELLMLETFGVVLEVLQAYGE